MYYNPVNALASVITATTTGTKVTDLIVAASGVGADFESGLNEIIISNEDATNGVRLLPGIAPTATAGLLIAAGKTVKLTGTSCTDWFIASTASTVSCSVLLGKTNRN